MSGIKVSFLFFLVSKLTVRVSIWVLMIVFFQTSLPDSVKFTGVFAVVLRVFRHVASSLCQACMYWLALDETSYPQVIFLRANS